VLVLAKVLRQIGLVLTDEKVVVEKRERAHAFGNFRGTLAAAGKTSVILDAMKEKYIALIGRANNPFIVLGRFTGIAKARNFAHQKNIKFYSIMSEKEWRTAAEFYAEHA
jgi:hypothetical protein